MKLMQYIFGNIHYVLAKLESHIKEVIISISSRPFLQLETIIHKLEAVIVLICYYLKVLESSQMEFLAFLCQQDKTVCDKYSNNSYTKEYIANSTLLLSVKLT